VPEYKCIKHRSELKIAYHRTLELSERVKKLKAKLEREKKAKDEALIKSQKYYEKTIVA